MSLDLPPIMLLRAFDAAGRHRSFKRAAEVLHVTPSTISHQITELEAHLGVSLFVRERRGVALTPEGSALLQEVAPAFERLRAATTAIRRGGQPTAVRISANPFFAAEILVPQIAAFDAAFPGISIHVSATETLEDPRDGRVDFCVRMGAAPAPGLDRHELYAVSIAPVVGAQISSLAPPRIDFPFHGNSAWQQWSARVAQELDPNTPVRQFSSYDAALRAAAQGLGVTLAMLPVVQPWLDQGLLQRVVGAPEMSIGPLELLSRPLTPSASTLRAVRDWLIAAFRAAAQSAC